MAIKSHVNSKRIAKNTLLLYVRMILMMAVTLYTSRVILQVLGVTDFGIYNVVGGIVTMLSFLYGAMTTSTQRYFTYYLGLGEREELGKVFTTSVQILAIISFVIILLAETIGLWFMYSQMVIPASRFTAALWVFHLSVVAMVIKVMSVPYNAAIVAHEKMGAFAYISIMEVLLKLFVVYLLMLSNSDKLIVYAILIVIVQFLVRYLYTRYCLKNFEETHLRRVWDVELLKKMGSFAGWNLWGGLAATLFGQGLNLLLNVFFGPVVNAARGITTQVESALNQMATNFQMAVNPQLTKSYAAGHLSEMHDLLFRSSKFSFFLIFLFALPLLLETDTVLLLWLKTPPEYTSLFVKITLCTILVDATAQPIVTAAAATGDVKVYQSVIGGILLLIVPIAYIVLKLGGSPVSVYFVHFSIIILTFFVRLIIVRPMIQLSIFSYMKMVVLPVVGVVLLASLLSVAVYSCHGHGIIDAIINMLSGLVIAGIAIYLTGLDSRERNFVNEKLRVTYRSIAR